MKSIVLIALFLIGCNSQQRNEPKTYAVGDSVVFSLNSEIVIDSSGFAAADTARPRYIRLLIAGSNDDSAKFHIKFLGSAAIPPQMKRVVAITHVGDFSISFTTESEDFVELSKKYGSVHHAITSDDPQYILFVDARFDISEVAEYLKYEADKRNKGLHHD